MADNEENTTASAEKQSKSSRFDSNQRRTLWIMAAAGIFLLVVIGAAVILYSPAVHQKDTKNVQTASYDPNDGWNETGLNEIGADGFVESSSYDDGYVDVPLSPFDNSNVTDITENKDETKNSVDSNEAYSFDLADLKGFSSQETSDATSNVTQKPSKMDTILADSAFASDAEAVKKSLEGDSSIDLNKITPPKTSNVSAKNDYTAAKIETAKSNVATTATQSTSPSKPKITPSKKISGDAIYWVQVGSFRDLNKANAARIYLEQNGFSNILVQVKTTGDEKMYRVRVGSYPKKSQAEDARTKIIKFKGFEKSYVVNSNAPAVRK